MALVHEIVYPGTLCLHLLRNKQVLRKHIVMPKGVSLE